MLVFDFGPYKWALIILFILLILEIIRKIITSRKKNNNFDSNFVNKMANIESRVENEVDKVEKSDNSYINCINEYKSELCYNKDIESYDSFSLKVENVIKKRDLNFNKNEFFDWVKKLVFVSLTSKENNNKSLENLFTKKYLDDVDSKNKMKDVCGLSSQIDKINIDFISFNKYVIIDGYEIVNVILRIKLFDLVDDNGFEKEFGYNEKSVELVLKRSLENRCIGNDTTVNSLVCPVCGGKINIEENKCEYCGNVVVLEYEDWKIDNILSIND